MHLSPIPTDKSSLCLTCILTGEFEVFLHHGLQMCFQNMPSFVCKHPFPQSHVCGFSLSFGNTSVCPNLSDQKGVAFGLWSHLSVSLISITHRSSERSAGKGRNSPSSLLSKSLYFRHIQRHENRRCLVW